MGRKQLKLLVGLLARTPIPHIVHEYLSLTSRGGVCACVLVRCGLGKFTSFFRKLYATINYSLFSRTHPLIFWYCLYSPLLSYFASFACIIVFSLIFQTPKRQINLVEFPSPPACTYKLVLFVQSKKLPWKWKFYYFLFTFQLLIKSYVIVILVKTLYLKVNALN